jgi:hypothetical protein
VGFEPTIIASERAKTVPALDHSVTVTGHSSDCQNTIMQARNEEIKTGQ